MKIKNKGKVFPSPSSSPSSSSSNEDYLSVLKLLLPAAILALASVLSLEEREVLAYLITRSIKTTPGGTSSSSSITQRKSSKKAAAAAANGSGISSSSSNNNNGTHHKPPVFDCDCFDCYTSYWFRWDSSPNRELIHKAIEAFEDHLTNGESEKSKKNGKAKRRDKTTRRFADKNQIVAVVEDTLESSGTVVSVDGVTEISPENDVVVAPMGAPEKVTPSVEGSEAVAVEQVSGESPLVEEEEEEEEKWSAASAAVAVTSCCSHKGLARKVLPDVLGLFNSRLWSLWSPNA